MKNNKGSTTVAVVRQAGEPTQANNNTKMKKRLYGSMVENPESYSYSDHEKD